MIFSHLRVKSPISKMIEGMTYLFYIFLLFNIVFYLKNKTKICKFKFSLNYF